MNIAAFSGGKDSTAMVLRMAELGEDFVMIFTATGDELPDVRTHMDRVQVLTDRELIVLPSPTLYELIEQWHALPNPRMRWCTTNCKILPCAAFLKANPGSTLFVGLRADEEERDGIYGPYATYRYPLREWEWGVGHVWAYLDERGVSVPRRTNCAMCYDQSVSEWYWLWRDHRETYEHAAFYEAQYGHSFRHPQQDDDNDEPQKWPVRLADLARKFQEGIVPYRNDGGRRVSADQEEMLDTRRYRRFSRCRVCSL